MKRWRERPAICLLGVAGGAAVCAFALNGFLLPSRIAPGGFTGLATLAYFIWGIPVGITVLILNVPALILGFSQLGKVFILRSMLGMTVYSVMTDVLPTKDLAGDTFLSAIYGGVLMGVGIGLTIYFGGSTGGIDIVAKLLHSRYRWIGMGSFIFAIDGAVIAISGAVLGINVALLAILSVYISSKVLEFITEGSSQARTFLILTPKAENLRQEILVELSRGVTGLKGYGGYSGMKLDILLCTVDAGSEVMHLKQLIQKIDPHSFVISWQAKEVLGEGFSTLNGTARGKVEISAPREYNDGDKKGGITNDPD